MRPIFIGVKLIGELNFSRQRSGVAVSAYIMKISMRIGPVGGRGKTTVVRRVAGTGPIIDMCGTRKKDWCITLFYTDTFYGLLNFIDS